ncbi:MAG: hypothetical protein BV459_01850 [Thermoplasmata archaeon M11B2D]|nr:MAG: hypothetical protein BV459_01850 [Thermoplasmata archaeon M11B2D]
MSNGRTQNSLFREDFPIIKTNKFWGKLFKPNDEQPIARRMMTVQYADPCSKDSTIFLVGFERGSPLYNINGDDIQLFSQRANIEFTTSIDFVGKLEPELDSLGLHWIGIYYPSVAEINVDEFSPLVSSAQFNSLANDEKREYAEKTFGDSGVLLMRTVENLRKILVLEAALLEQQPRP